MPSLDESIRKIDNVICRHLDEIENNSRGAISQDILEQLTKFVNHVMLKFMPTEEKYLSLPKT